MPPTQPLHSFYTLQNNSTAALSALPLPNPTTTLPFSLPKLQSLARSAMSKDSIDQGIEQRFFSSPSALIPIPNRRPRISLSPTRTASPLSSPSARSEAGSSPLVTLASLAQGQERRGGPGGEEGSEGWYKPFKLANVYFAQRDQYELERQRWWAIYTELNTYHELAVCEAENVNADPLIVKQVMKKIIDCVNAAEQLVHWWKDRVVSPNGMESIVGTAEESDGGVGSKGKVSELTVNAKAVQKGVGVEKKGRGRPKKKKKKVTWAKVEGEDEEDERMKWVQKQGVEVEL